MLSSDDLKNVGHFLSLFTSGVQFHKDAILGDDMEIRVHYQFKDGKVFDARYVKSTGETTPWCYRPWDYPINNIVELFLEDELHFTSTEDHISFDHEDEAEAMK